MRTWIVAASCALAILLAGLAFLVVNARRGGSLSDRSSAVEAGGGDALAGDALAGGDSVDGGSGTSTSAARVGAGRHRRGLRDRPTASDGVAGGSANDGSGLDSGRREEAGSGCALEVIVVDRAGDGIADALVALVAASGGGIEARTERDGSVAFDGLASGAYRVRIAIDERGILETARSVVLAGGEAHELRLLVGPTDLAIGGRVIDEDGAALAGVRVELTPYAPAAAPDTLVPALDGGKNLSGETDASGRYEVGGLPAGEYEVATIATDEFASARRVVRAGLRSVDFVLRRSRAVRLSGLVTTAEGDPLEGAAAFPLELPSAQALTGEDGRYELELPLASERTIFSIAFSADGFRTERVHLRHADLIASDEHALDVSLDPLGEAAPVGGLLVSAEGAPIRAETVYLQSARLQVRTSAVSDATGAFDLGDVPLGTDYRLWVYPRAEFKDAVREPLEVTPEGLYVELTLDEIGVGAVRGRMVDVRGQPVPGFRMWVRSTQALARARPLASGPGGEFEANDVPAGELVFETRSQPRFTIRGLTLEAGAEAEVDLVLDWGERSIRGTVVDDSGEPVSLARVDLHWQHAWEAGRSTSYRSTSSDRAGRFEFSELGGGAHKLIVDAAGFRRQRVQLDLDSEEAQTTIVLERAAATGGTR